MHYINARTILNNNHGAVGMNLYRGCSHGCIYCDSRSRVYQMDHPFEDIAVKQNAPELLEKALGTKRKKCMIGTGSMSDPYIPLEEELQLTRRCLEIIRNHDFGVTMITKSDRILRDLDLLVEIHRRARCVLQMSLTTWDEALCRVLEPGVCNSQRRVEVLRILRDHGIPTVVWLTPILPYINDTEENLLSILSACAEADVQGIICFGMGVTMREGNREYFYEALDRHFPGMKDRYIRSFGLNYQLISPNHRPLMKLFHGFCRKHGIIDTPEDCFRFLSEFQEKDDQISFFDI